MWLLKTSRTFFGALVPIFNNVSKERIKEVGPDRACAEWLMRNGVYIRWAGETDFVKHYDQLPLDPQVKGDFIIQEIKGEGATISHHGFPHFKSCQIETLCMDRFYFVDDLALKKLSYLKNSLVKLTILNCLSLTDGGLESLSQMVNLKEFSFGKLLNVKNPDKFTRNIFTYLNNVFNNVSKERIANVGPDRACAEWLMRNGAYVKWTDSPMYVAHYNNLPLKGTSKNFHIEEIKAINASINNDGFEHFNGCDHITSFMMDNCCYINDDAIFRLKYLKNSLIKLTIRNCNNVTEEGLYSLKIMENIKEINIGYMMNVKNPRRVVRKLQHWLPSSTVSLE